MQDRSRRNWLPEVGHLREGILIRDVVRIERSTGGKIQIEVERGLVNELTALAVEGWEPDAVRVGRVVHGEDGQEETSQHLADSQSDKRRGTGECDRFPRKLFALDGTAAEIAKPRSRQHRECDPHAAA